MGAWTAILEQLTRFLAAFMQWFQQNQLIQAGQDQAKLEAMQAEAELRKKLDAIDNAQPPGDPQSIIDRL